MNKIKQFDVETHRITIQNIKHMLELIFNNSIPNVDICVAGSYALHSYSLDVLGTPFDYGDVDLYFTSEADLRTAVNVFTIVHDAVLVHLSKNSLVFEVKQADSCLPRINFITRMYGASKQLVSTFDFTAMSFGVQYVPRHDMFFMFGHTDFERDFKDKVLYINNVDVDSIDSSIQRTYKYYNRGFNVPLQTIRGLIHMLDDAECKDIFAEIDADENDNNVIVPSASSQSYDNLPDSFWRQF